MAQVNYEPNLSSRCQELPEKSFEMTRKAYPAYAYKIIRVRGQFNLDPKNSDLNMTFRFLFGLFSEMANLFWL